jgi:membrane protein YdbS with pleckstrin-like domain
MRHEPSPHVAPARTGEVTHAPQPILNIDAPGITGISATKLGGALPAELIRDDEIIILILRPSMLFIVLSCTTSLAVIAIISLALAWLSSLPWARWTDYQAIELGVAMAALRLCWQTLEWWSRLYVLTDRRVIRRAGVLRVYVFEAALNRIQHTVVVRGILERLFGLGTIGFATAGSDTFDAFWVMLRHPFKVHRIVVDAIRRYGKH